MPTTAERLRLVARIDAIIRELEELRRQLACHLEPLAEQKRPSLAHQLYGALGTGSWEEYDSLADWQRFSE